MITGFDSNISSRKPRNVINMEVVVLERSADGEPVELLLVSLPEPQRRNRLKAAFLCILWFVFLFFSGCDRVPDLADVFDLLPRPPVAWDCIEPVGIPIEDQKWYHCIEAIEIGEPSR